MAAVGDINTLISDPLYDIDILLRVLSSIGEELVFLEFFSDIPNVDLCE